MISVLVTGSGADQGEFRMGIVSFVVRAPGVVGPYAT
jgi:hypothetical protein